MDDEDRIGPYLIGDEIGRGSFATVYQGERHDTGSLVAIKSVIRSKLTTKLLENLESEISILKRITHRNIVELKDCLKTDTHIYLIMDFCAAGDLSIYIRKRGDLPSLTASNAGLLPDSRRDRDIDRSRVLYPHPKEGGLNETIVRCFLGQLVDALRFLRSQNVIHRDIKPQNLLLQPAGAADLAAGHPPGIPVLKVADFGFARWLPSQSMAETLLYMAPEILRYEKYDAKADLWSVGAVLFEMSVGKPPFRAQNHVDLLRKIERGEDRIKFPDEKRVEEGSDKTPTKVAPDVKALIRRLLKRHPSERMGFEDFFCESDAVAVGGTAAQLPSAEAVSARHDAVTSSAGQPGIPRAVARQGSPIVPPSSVAAANPSSASSPQTHASSPASPALPPVPPAPVAAARPSPSLPSAVAQQHSRIPSYGADLDPPPFARRPSAAPSPSPPLSAAGAAPGSMRRNPSFPSKYVVGGAAASGGVSGSGGEAGGSGIVRAASSSQQQHAGEPEGGRQTGYAIQRAGSRQDGVDSPGPSSGPPSAIERFANTNKTSGSMTDSNDSVLGKDYVVVEKRTVEINALADELAQAPKRDTVVARRPSRGFLTRPLSSLGNPAGSSPPSSSSPSSPFTHGGEGRFPGSPLALVGSPSAALAKAFSNLSPLKLFGSPTDGILVRRSSVRKPIPRSMTAPAAADPEEERILADLEDIAQKALVLFEYADSKILQLLPPTPAASTSTTSLGTPSYFSHMAAREAAGGAAANPFSAIPTSPSMRRGSSSSSDRPLVMASSARAEVLAAEAMVLYLKALAFLGKGIERARRHWANRPSEQTSASADFNDAVQWFRQRFNECFDKADFAKTRAQDEIPESAAFAEKLVYDRALELSRAAAVNELRGESPADCETAYETALWMLYALLDPTMTGPAAPNDPGADEDRVTVGRFVQSITARLQALRKKIAPAPGAAGSTAPTSGSSTPSAATTAHA
ncbi:Serine/threonine-protein kinase [Rhodosporidiobolus nylandii]